jgi:hypothetical protein
MIAWIKENIGFKNLLILLLVIIVIIGFLKGPSLYRNFKKVHYEGVTKGIVVDIQERKTSVQHINGTHSKVVGFDLTYTYTIHGEKYKTTGFIEPGKEIKFLFDKFTQGDSCIIEIGYMLKKPEESILIGFP